MLYLFVVRVRVRVTLDYGFTVICLHRYGGISSEGASRKKQRIGPIKTISNRSW